ncbi:MAG: PTS sugar transporter subunit IIA [Elusimicrobia bacterium]|nr:PTS sugar transporter subunit IIA [Elusimicrobiota bacterium]
MSLLDYLPLSAISVDIKSQTKKEALKELVSILAKAHSLKNSEKILEALLEREELGSTGIGQGIAIPHGKTEHANKIIAALGISKRGIDFNALDGEPVHLFFMLVAPQNSPGTHLKILAKISRLLKDKFFRQALRESKTAEEALKQIQQENEY